MNSGVHVNEASAVQQSGDASGADRWVGAGGSTAADVEAAVDEAWTVAVGGRVPGLVIVFCSTAYPLADVAAAVETRAGGAPVIGCSTSGEVATEGPSESGLALWALGGDGFDVPLPFPESTMPNRQQLDAMAARIGSMLRDPLRNSGMKE